MNKLIRVFSFSIMMLFFSNLCFAAQEHFVFDSPQQQQEFEGMLKEFRCVTCPNQNIADSSAPVARAMQEEIYNRVKLGESKETISEYLQESYGDYVIYKPRVMTQTWVLWFGPFIMLIIGSVLWFKFFSKTKDKK